ncbi:spermidine/putrescine ABC transporter substrate-binding protein [Burkholderia sp. MSh2]|uniref:Putrescine-binding periplasmic protein n=1 Tax=Burkholderia paludis TaxID=1506587 RepID=A0A6J5DFQ4_9BURK|nr:MULTISPECIES: extracellular solute-binding protein [Burkholderia]KEZ04093.1 spermidine/putrescine ABC transporter substrate-binding protein [Burkholderia sp. MSh2]CAB3753099.1 Spermidine-binding periplasmic protein SpuE [Burkholderia paludis]VWB65410.1 putrescine ABC transporter periplasmic putrescine-binding protein [Burkholderia paludis]
MKYLTRFIFGVAMGFASIGLQAAELHFANWSNYYPPELLKKFEKETGIKTTLDSYADNDELLAKLRAGSGSYDVVVVSDSYVQIMARGDMLRKIDKAKLPNFSGITEKQFSSPAYDPARTYTMPYLWGSDGLVYDSRQVPGGKIDDSWKSLFVPAEALRGRIGVLNIEEELYSAAAFYAGVDPCTENPNDAKKILDILSAQKPYVQTFDSNPISVMQAGTVAMHLMWNGAFLRAKKQRPSLVFVYPREGVKVFQDNFAIPATAKNVNEALTFLNWMLKPENIAAASNFTGYSNAIPASYKLLKPDMAQDASIVVPDSMKPRLRPFEQCSTAALQLRNKVWVKFKQ